MKLEDKALWKHVKRSIKPLRVQPKDNEILPEVLLAPAIYKPPASPKLKPVKQGLKPLAEFEKSVQLRLTRKQLDPQARLDLHGLYQDTAHLRLKNFIIQAQSEGVRLAIIITGKGSQSGGILRQSVPQWLAMPDLRPYIIGFQEAELHHGGEGALYVRIRKAK